METSENTKNFQLKLFQQLNQEYKNKNLSFSPMSVYLILSLLLNGANGETRKELMALLGKGDSFEEINLHVQKIVSTLSSAECLKNGNLVATNGALMDEYKALCEKLLVDIKPLTTSEKINSWVKEKTNGLIQSIIDSIDNIKTLLINTLYFKVTWLYRFKKENTKKFPFTCSDGTVVQCNMMIDYGKHVLYTNGDHYYTHLKYKENPKINALVVVPTEQTIDEFIASLDNEKIQNMINSGDLKQSFIYLPRFNTQSKTAFNKSLKVLGVEKALSNKGNYSNMNTEGKLEDLDLQQICMVKVDEDGTTAVASSSVKHGGFPTVKCDKPFLFIVRHDDFPEQFLFISKIENPNI